MAEPRLSIADQVFVNAFLVLVLPEGTDPKRQELARGVIADVLDRVTRNHPYLEPMIEEAEIMLAAQKLNPKERRAEMFGATFRGGRLASHFALWRCGLAQEALNKQEETV